MALVSRPYSKSFLLIFGTIVLLHLPPAAAHGDSGGCPGAETHRSPNGLFSLSLLPIGSCYKPGYRLQWTYGKTGGPAYFRRDGFYPTDVSISNDGERIVLAGNYVHNLLGRFEEGLWIYTKSGDLVRRVDAPAVWPVVRSTSSRWWFSRSRLSSAFGLYILTSADGVRRIYRLSSGDLVLVLPALWQALCVAAAWLYGLTASRAYPRLADYRQLMRGRIEEKGLAGEALRQVRRVLRAFAYSLLSTAFAFLFLSVWYLAYPALARIIPGNDIARSNAHFGQLDAGFWLRMTAFEACVFFLAHLLVGVFVSGRMSLKRSLTTAASYAIIFLLVMADTAAYYYPVLFLPIVACTFLFWPQAKAGPGGRSAPG